MTYLSERDEDARELEREWERDRDDELAERDRIYSEWSEGDA